MDRNQHTEVQDMIERLTAGERRAWRDSVIDSHIAKHMASARFNGHSALSGMIEGAWSGMATWNSMTEYVYDGSDVEEALFCMMMEDRDYSYRGHA